VTLEMLLSEDEFVSSEDWSAIMEQMIPINYVGHGGTYDQQDEIDGVKTIEFRRDFLDVDTLLDVTSLKKSSDKQYITGKGRHKVLRACRKVHS
jgi:hypothetical protein